MKIKSFQDFCCVVKKYLGSFCPHERGTDELKLLAHRKIISTALKETYQERSFNG
jgi:hypothetical protein